MNDSTTTTVPFTWEGTSPEDLVGKLVGVRPHYSVPSSRSSLTPARSPFTFEARVVEVFGSESVLVEFARGTSVPWERRAMFHPHELHRAGRECACPACTAMGDGIHTLHGA